MLLDVYKLFKVLPTVSDAELRKAYHSARGKSHPDKGGTDEKFRIVLEAWSLVETHSKRQSYDYRYQIEIVGKPKNTQSNDSNSYQKEKESNYNNDDYKKDYYSAYMDDEYEYESYNEYDDLYKQNKTDDFYKNSYNTDTDDIEKKVFEDILKEAMLSAGVYGYDKNKFNYDIYSKRVNDALKNDINEKVRKDKEYEDFIKKSKQNKKYKY